MRIWFNFFFKGHLLFISFLVRILWVFVSVSVYMWSYNFALEWVFSTHITLLVFTLLYQVTDPDYIDDMSKKDN